MRHWGGEVPVGAGCKTSFSGDKQRGIEVERVGTKLAVSTVNAFTY